MKLQVIKIERDDWRIPKTKIPDTVKFPKYENSRNYKITEI